MIDTLQQRLLFNELIEKWALPQDHISIRIDLDLRGANKPQTGRERYALAKLNLEALRDAVQISHWAAAPDPLKRLQKVLESQLPLVYLKTNLGSRARPE